MMQVLIDGSEFPIAAAADAPVDSVIQSIKSHLRQSGRCAVSIQVHGFGDKSTVRDVLLVDVNTSSIKEAARQINESLNELITHGPMLNQAAALSVDYPDEAAEAIEEALGWWESVIEAAESLESIGDCRWVDLVDSAAAGLQKVSDAKDTAELSDGFSCLTMEAERWRQNL